MNANKITVVTATLGEHSEERIAVLFADMHKYTKLPFKHILCDDGTVCQHSITNKKRLCDENGITFLENPGPIYGISYNLNFALEHVETPWVFMIEDGLRPSADWLETAADFIDKIGDKEWCGYKVGMAGMASMQDWILAMGKVWPGVDVVPVFHGQKRDIFYSDNWNDGYWCWKRLDANLASACYGDTSLWTADLLQFKSLVVEGVKSLQSILHPSDLEQALQKWKLRDHWPINRTAACSWYPGAFMLINMDAWRKVGKFRNGCTFFEGHLGVRMGMNGYLSLCVESPPFLHCPSQGFSSAPQGKTPRDHRDTTSVFLEDFKCDSLDAWTLLAKEPVVIAASEINQELSKVELDVSDEWSKWI